jgi:uncharacterized protein YdeI (YjbR/CyaY-like superfamily)
MPRDPRIDEKIAKAPDFARPVLQHFRGLVHATVPEVEEAIKWGMPHFVYKGKNIAGMASFKAHCAVMIHGAGRQGDGADGGMGSYGKITSLADLPGDAELTEKLRAAAGRVDATGTAVKRTPVSKQSHKPDIPVPDDLAAALSANGAAEVTFESLAASHRWEYLDWITGAKREETRAKRIAEAVGWLAEGKRRNWKYEP